MITRFPIEEELRSLATLDGGRYPDRPEFQDPLLVSFQGVSLSSLIDEELDRFYNPASPVDMISRVFRRFRRRPADA